MQNNNTQEIAHGDSWGFHFHKAKKSKIKSRKGSENVAGNVQFSNCPSMGHDRDINNGLLAIFPLPLQSRMHAMTKIMSEKV